MPARLWSPLAPSCNSAYRLNAIHPREIPGGGFLSGRDLYLPDVPRTIVHCMSLRGGHGPTWQSVPPWLPLRGSCHEVTERVKIALSALTGHLSHRERQGPHPSRLRRATFTLWSNCHWQLLNFDSLRGAPPRRGRLWKRIVTGGNPWKGPHQCEHWFAMTCFYFSAPLVRNDALYASAYYKKHPLCFFRSTGGVLGFKAF